jgi:hypothetical protein
MISTNKVKPKENTSFSKFLEEEKGKDGQPTGNIISHIPRDVFTTSQDRVKKRSVKKASLGFTDILKLDQKKPERTFIQTVDLEDMRRKAHAQKVEAAAKVAKKSKGTRKRTTRKRKKAK